MLNFVVEHRHLSCLLQMKRISLYVHRLWFYINPTELSLDMVSGFVDGL